MSIKAIKLRGFKTFAENIEIRLSHRLTAVVGPNGSGKSNLVDAIRWGIGEHSQKLLRISAPQDVIFAGLGDRKPLSLAEVSILLDNRGHKYPKDEEEIAIVRRAYRDGENEYVINGEKTRLKDIEDLFRGLGLGRQTYSVVGQGEVEQVISATPAERLKTMEELAGVDLMRATKRSVEGKIENARHSMEKIQAHISESQFQHERLAAQAEVLDRYQNLTEKLEHMKLQLHLINRAQVLDEMDALYSRSKMLETKRSEAQRELEQLEGAQDFSDELEELEKRRAETLSQREQAIMLSSRSQAQLEHIRTKHAETIELLQKGNIELETILRRSESLVLLISDLESKAEKKRAEFELKSKALEEIEAKRPEGQDMGKERQKHQATLDNAKRQADDARNRLSETQSKITVLLERIRAGSARVRELQDLQDEPPQALPGVQSSLDTVLQKKAGVVGKLAALKEESSELAALATVKAEIKALEKEGERFQKDLASLSFLPSKLGCMVLSNALDLSGLTRKDGSFVKSQLDWIVADEGNACDIASMLPKGADAFIILGTPSFEFVDNIGEAIGSKARLKLTKDGFIMIDGAIMTVRERVSEAQIQGHLEENQRLIKDGLAKAAELEARAQDLEKKEASQNRALASLQAQELELSKQIASDKARAVEHKNRQSQRAEDIGRLTEIIEGLKQTLKAAEAEQAGLNERLKECVESMRQAGAKLSEFDAGRLKAQEDQVDFERSLSQAKEEKTRAKLEFDDATRSANLAKIELENGKDRAAKLEVANQQNTQTIKELEQSVIDGERESNTAKMTILRTDKQEKEISERKRQINEELGNRANQVKNVRGRLTRYGADLHQLELQLVEQKVKSDELATRIAEAGGDTTDRIETHDVEGLKADVSDTTRRLAEYGAVNMAAKEESKTAKERLDFLSGQLNDLAQTEANLRSALSEVEVRIKQTFEEVYRSVETNFRTLAGVLFEGAGGNLRRLMDEKGETVGVEVEFLLPGRRLKGLHALSGGEKTLAALALLFAFFKTKSSPFCVLDEVDAALDDSNIERFTRLLKSEAEDTQFVVITHNKETMRWCDALYGITLDGSGTSRVVSVRLDDTEN